MLAHMTDELRMDQSRRWPGLRLMPSESTATNGCEYLTVGRCHGAQISSSCPHDPGELSRKGLQRQACHYGKNARADMTLMRMEGILTGCSMARQLNFSRANC